MARGAQRPPRHARQSSRIATLVTGNRQAQKYAEAETKRSTDDDQTIRYIKRTLCSPKRRTEAGQTDVDLKPLEELLPPLTSSNEVDVQLYALIAVILSNFVQAWYNKITPDQDFVAEIVRIVAHCTRGFEQRLRTVDLESVLLDELPSLACDHLQAARVAFESSLHSVLKNDARFVFHALRQHVALTPPPTSHEVASAQAENEGAWSQMLVDRILPLLLPPEDLANPCLQVLVSDIFADMVVKNGICGKASEAWLIWEGITKVVTLLRPDSARPVEVAASSSPVNRLEQFGLLANESKAGVGDRPAHQRRGIDALAQVFWTIVQSAALALTFGRSFVTALIHASSIPPRKGVSDKPRTPTTHDEYNHAKTEGISTGADAVTDSAEVQPIVSLNVWSSISLVLSLDRRMPWLKGSLSLLQWLSLYGPGNVCGTNSALDRLLSSQIHATLLNVSLLPSLLRGIRVALFPNNALAPSRAVPSDEEAREIRRECARVIVDAVPSWVRERFFATQDSELMMEDVEGTLDLFSDPYINKHLIVAAVELLVVRLFPELAESGS